MSGQRIRRHISHHHTSYSRISQSDCNAVIKFTDQHDSRRDSGTRSHTDKGWHEHSSARNSGDRKCGGCGNASPDAAV